MNKQYYVYIMSNVSRTLYIGVTNDLQRRLWQHKKKVNQDCFTARYNCTRLVYYAVFSTPREAIMAEKRLKGWTRAKKLQLIQEENPQLRDISNDVFGDAAPLPEN